jgi:hypothetical protein
MAKSPDWFPRSMEKTLRWREIGSTRWPPTKAGAMKKHILVLLLFSSNIIYAQDYFKVNWNIGNLGYGVNIPSNERFEVEKFGNILNIGIEHKYTRIGIEYSPIKYFAWRY